MKTRWTTKISLSSSVLVSLFDLILELENKNSTTFSGLLNSAPFCAGDNMFELHCINLFEGLQFFGKATSECY